MKFLVTGGAGFIGSALVRKLVAEGERVVTVDSLNYAGTTDNLVEIEQCSNHVFHQIDIRRRDDLRRVLWDEAPDAVIHLAAETHVDRSIDDPGAFVDTNIVGTFNLLEEVREYARGDFRLLHVSTDEVFGALGAEGAFTECTPYAPNSPYSASKAAADHLVRAWHTTYGIPTLLTNCSNNYGPYQFPEKLLPLVVLKAFSGESIPLYGDGLQVRDWLHVDDHVAALRLVLEKGTVGRSYNIGARDERTNRDMIGMVLDAVALTTGADRSELQSLIRTVADRPGHDRRYAIDPTRIETELGWRAEVPLEEGLGRTVAWYRDHGEWCERVSTIYDGERLGRVHDN